MVVHGNTLSLEVFGTLPTRFWRWPWSRPTFPPRPKPEPVGDGRMFELPEKTRPSPRPAPTPKTVAPAQAGLFD